MQSLTKLIVISWMFLSCVAVCCSEAHATSLWEDLSHQSTKSPSVHRTPSTRVRTKVPQSSLNLRVLAAKLKIPLVTTLLGITCYKLLRRRRILRLRKEFEVSARNASAKNMTMMQPLAVFRDYKRPRSACFNEREILSFAECRLPQYNTRAHFTSNDFLEIDRRWKELRMTAIEKNKLLYGVSTCVICRRTSRDGIKINVDHIKPRKDFPELSLLVTNLQVLCSDCNCGKGNHVDIGWK